jgi:hypothetical protein
VPEIGEHWAYREKPRTPGGAFREVEVLQEGPGRKKYRIRWLDGAYRGMDEWVTRARLVVPWDEAARVAEDEQGMLALEALQPAPPNATTRNAVLQVYFGSRSDLISFDAMGNGPIKSSIEDLESRRDDLPLPADDLLASPGAFVDSRGELWVGQEATLRLARALCESEPDPILQRCDKDVDEWRAATVSGWIASDYYKEGGFHVHADAASERADEYAAARALVREWCGAGATERFDERQYLQAEVERLRGIIEDTARWLKQGGNTQKAARLLRDLRRT